MISLVISFFKCLSVSSVWLMISLKGLVRGVFSADCATDNEAVTAGTPASRLWMSLCGHTPLNIITEDLQGCIWA